MKSDYFRHHVLYNIFGSIVPIVVTVLTIPIYIRTIGETRYGLMTLIWLAFGYFGVFDFGLSRATAYRLSTIRDQDLPVRTSVFYTACTLNLVLGLTAAAIFFGLTTSLATFFTKDPAMRAETLQALPLVAAFFPIGLLGGVFNGCLQANRQFREINFQQSVGSILQQSLPLLAVSIWGVTLSAAVFGAVMARVCSVAWLGLVCLRWTIPAGRPSIRAEHVRKLFSYGGWVTISDMIAPFLNGLDQLLIGATLGPKATAYYSVSFSMASKALIVPASFTRALFPRLSNMSGSDARAVSIQSLSVVSTMMALICVPAIVLARVALALWIGEDFAQHAHLAASVLIVGMWINSVGYIPYTFLQAQGRPDLIAKIHAYEILPFLLVLFLLIGQFGLIGAAVAWVLRTLADTALQAHFAGFNAADGRAALFPGAVVTAALGVCFFDLGPVSAVTCSLSFCLCLVAWICTQEDLVRYARPGFWLG